MKTRMLRVALGCLLALALTPGLANADTVSIDGTAAQTSVSYTTATSAQTVTMTANQPGITINATVANITVAGGLAGTCSGSGTHTVTCAGDTAAYNTIQGTAGADTFVLQGTAPANTQWYGPAM